MTAVLERRSVETSSCLIGQMDMTDLGYHPGSWNILLLGDAAHDRGASQEVREAREFFPNSKRPSTPGVVPYAQMLLRHFRLPIYAVFGIAERVAQITPYDSVALGTRLWVQHSVPMRPKKPGEMSRCIFAALGVTEKKFPGDLRELLESSWRPQPLL